MSGQILNPSLYHVSHGMGRPSSVNSTATHYGAQLFFNSQFRPSKRISLTLSNIISAQNIPLDQTQFTFSWQQDTVAPGVVEALVLEDQQTVRIQFTESIAPLNPNPEIIGNYILHNHSNDPDNSIVRVAHEDDAVLVHLAHTVRYGSSAYKITINNLRDLAGSLISPQNNVARFYLVNNTTSNTWWHIPIPSAQATNSAASSTSLPAKPATSASTTAPETWCAPPPSDPSILW